LLGIAISVVSLAKIISWLLENQPVLLWSFFFGLVLASIFYIGKQITKWNALTIAILLIGAILAFWVTTLQPLVTENSSPVFLFIAGALAICAMILPGISGAFILVLLGAYKPVLEAVHNRDLKIILVIGSGAVVGLLIFSRVLKWLFHRFRNLMLAILTGFVLGSLNKIWPWKRIVETKIIEGKEIVLNEQSISPFDYGEDNQLFLAIFFAGIGFMVILLLEKLAIKK
jgi:putative membrane protein